jgi:tRNA pseudouridine55 synthase
MSRRDDKFHGLLRVNKPSGMTSHDVVDRIRHIIGQRSVGHAGTLDPAAEGLLLVCLGKATKVVRFLTQETKRYEATIALGRESKTYDAEGVDLTQPSKDIPVLTSEQWIEILSRFSGDIPQQVPAYSAVQIDGERLYKAARRGEDFEPPVRTITIHRLQLLSAEADRINIDVTCSKGTYIRSLAHDIGRAVGCGGYLLHLRRTEIGDHKLSQAMTLEALERQQQENNLALRILPIESLLNIQSITVVDGYESLLRNGRAPRAADVVSVDGAFESGDAIAVRNHRGRILAIGKATIASRLLRQNTAVTVFEFDRVLV